MGTRGIFCCWLIKDNASFVVGFKKVRRQVRRGGNEGQSEVEWLLKGEGGGERVI